MNDAPDPFSHAPLTILAAKFWPQRHGGVETHLWQMSRSLAQQGVNVNVLTDNRDNLPAQQTVLPGLQVHRFAPMHAGRLWRWPQALLLRWWKQVIKAHRPTGYIWATQPVMAAAAILAGYKDQLIFNPACCVSAMRAMGLADERMNTLRLPRMTQWMERLAYRHSPRVVVSSKNLADQFIAHHGRHASMTILPLAAEPASQTMPDRWAMRRKWGIPDEALVVGFVGRLDPCKDLDYLFAGAGLSQTRQQSSDHLRLLVVGDGPDHQRLREVAVAQGVSRQIIWAGAMQDPAAAYAAMDVLALTSAYEAFGLVILEAMAMGVPVLGRKADGQRVLNACCELINDLHDGLLTHPHDPADLARAIDHFAASPLLRSALSTQARHTAHNRHWQAYATRCCQMLGLRSDAKPMQHRAA